MHDSWSGLRRDLRAAAAVLLFAMLAIMCMAEVTPLHAGWNLQSACKLESDGATISTTSFHPVSWIATTVPTTVLAAQVAAGIFKDPDYGTNLRSIPGTTYAIGSNFSNQPMTSDSAYHCGWWYRKTFSVPAGDRGKTLWLRFAGINYRGDLWINGQKAVGNKIFQGAFTHFDFDVTRYLIAGKENALAVEVFAPTENDLAMAWADWSPMPPDKVMGIWETVDLVATGPIEVKSPAVTTHFTDASLKEADLTVFAEVRNSTDKPVGGVLTATLEGVHVEQPVKLAPNEDKSVSFTPDEFARLKIRNPHIWWPYQMGQPNLETLSLNFSAGGHVSDTVTTRYGIREVTSELIDRSTKGNDIVAAKPEPPPPPEPPAPPPAPRPRGTLGAGGGGTQGAPRPKRPPDPPQQVFRLFRVNGKPILVRGGGWTPDMMLRNDPEKLRAQFRMVRDMGLNTIRSEGKMETEDFFHLADEQGVLVMIGWTCCDRWERWTRWTDENKEVALESLHSQLLRLRTHPSVLMWMNGSDNPPTPEIETMYLKEETDQHWPTPTVSSATRRQTSVTGESGVKMEGPYDYVAPAYWLTDTRYGGAWGFATEIGPGPAIPRLDSMKKFIPAADIWPHDDVWKYHAGGGGFKDVTAFNNAMDATYGGAQNSLEYDRISQTMAYDGERAMFEAYSRNKYNSTGVIQWMLNNSWPSLIWHLYDYYLDTGGGYFGTKKACEPLHIQYSYDDHSIWVVNSTYVVASDLTAVATVYDSNLNKIFEDKATVQSTPDSALSGIAIPDKVFASDTGVHFVQLTLKNKAGAVVSRNFYWVPAKASTYDWAKTRYTTSPILTYEDLTVLRKLPQAKVDASVQIVGGKAEVHLHNASSALAFQIAVTTNADESERKTGEKVSPVLWSDNYVELLPGESLTLSASLPAKMNGTPQFRITGWNIAEKTMKPGTTVANK
ncbi:MAG: sugar-binding domain-containing protein [Terracidiphilus sp.]